MLYKQIAACMRAHGVGGQRVGRKVWGRKKVGTQSIGAQSIGAQNVERKVEGGAKFEA